MALHDSVGLEGESCRVHFYNIARLIRYKEKKLKEE